MTGAPPPRLNNVKTRHDLSTALGVPVKYLINRAFNVDQNLLYQKYSIPKRSGGEREIHAPRWPLANIQYEIRLLLEEIYRPSNRVMGFVKKRGIRENAKFHVGKRHILNIDLKDYFGSIHFGRIRSRLMARPYLLTNEIATLIAKLCTLEGTLPTGAPTSPILANIVTSSLDGMLAKYARERGCFYTRYADDLTFSTNRATFPASLVRRSHESLSGVEAAPELVDIIENQGFAIQARKTRLMAKHMRQEVCGVTCNERLNVRRTLMREVRGALHAWRKHGKNAAELEWKKKYNWRNAQCLERSLRGRIEHIIHIKGRNDKSVNNLVGQFNQLTGRVFKNIYYDYQSTDPIGIHESITLINCADDDALDWKQGSGFVIDNGSVLTNYHVISYTPTEANDAPLKDKIYPKIRLSFEGQSAEHDMEVTHVDIKKDIAVLRVKDTQWLPLFKKRACKISFADPAQGDKVTLAGYPSHTEGGSCKIVPGYVTGKANYEGNQHFTISQIIVQGNSGGPVIDEFGQVIGIATKGVPKDEKENLTYNGCLPMYAIDKVIFD